MPLDPDLRRSLAAHIAYFRDLGIFDFYRREGGVPPQEHGTEAQPAAALSPKAPLTQSGSPVQLGSVSPPVQLSGAEEFAIRSGNHFSPQPKVLASREERLEALRAIREEIGDCTRCELARSRNKIVFGEGDPNARLFFVGEGPGADEDAQGRPFVGRAGQLLNNMIAAMGLNREQVYIANIVKCRPPQNRIPEPEEAHTCSPFLFRQIDVIRPEVLVALGATAALYLLGFRAPLNNLRGRVHRCRDTKLIVTYHPAYLLRDPRQKKEAWRDLQLVMAELGLSSPVRG